MMRSLTVARALLASFLFAATAAHAQQVPLGHRNFYPSATQPVGFRGDGNGYFPGATPVAEWCEGTPERKKTGRDESWSFRDNKTTNIVWKTEMPAWANTPPIVVGDRVFVKCEPHTLTCVDANTGKILWSRENSVWQTAGLPKDLVAKLQVLEDVHFVLNDFLDWMGRGGDDLVKDPLNGVCETFARSSLPRLRQALEQADPGQGYDRSAKKLADALAERLKLAQPDKHWGGYRDLSELSGLIAKRIASLSQLKARIEIPWGNMVGWSAAAPVSDGEFVFATFGQGQVVCYDLRGNKVWGFWFPQNDRNAFIPSPVLAGDILMVMTTPSRLRGVDKKTGKTLWETDYKGCGGYSVGTHKVVHLENAKLGLDVVVTAPGTILRVSDGKVIGDLPYEENRHGGPSITQMGDIVYKAACGDSFAGPLVACRLRLVSADSVQAEKIWEAERGRTYQTGPVTPQFLIQEETVLDPRTGKVLVRKTSGLGHISNIVAGNLFVWADNDPWNDNARKVKDSQALLGFHAADFSDPARPKRLSDKNVLGGINMPRWPVFEKYAPELYGSELYWQQWAAKPTQFMKVDTGIFAQGNRLFIRSVSHLYCIGDPAVPYDWNPSSRRKAVANTIK